MAKNIKWFEINSYGEVKIKVDQPTYSGRDVEYHYWSLPTSIIRKLINAAKQPTLEEFEDWVQAHLTKEKKTNSNELCGCSSSMFWTSKD